MLRHFAVVFALMLASPFPQAGAQRAPDAQSGAGTEAGSYPAIPLFSTGKTVVGETIRYPAGAPAQVTASIIALPPGGRTITHKHGVPLFAYILEGELTVDYGKHGTRTYKAGDSFMEAMNVAHHGVNKGSVPVRLIAVYMGATNAKDVIPAK